MELFVDMLEVVNKTDLEIPTNRTKTPLEALDDSLLTHLDIGNVTKDTLTEAICRDFELFSPAYSSDDEALTKNRPRSCTGELNDTICAKIYDNEACPGNPYPNGNWVLGIPDGTQRQFRYFSSDYQYRNDAEMVGVRSGCTFTGWTSTGYSGNSFTITAGATDRWVRFKWKQAYLEDY